jgi:hypothetical protein
MQNRVFRIRIRAAGASAALLLSLLPVLAAAPRDPDPSTLHGKVLLGYQGWFSCPGDGSPANNWRSWARGVPAPATLTIDMYPDLRELDPDERCPVPEMTIGGAPAYLYSAWNRKTVERHFLWMKQYGLDGVLIQRFVNGIAAKRASGDVVLKNTIAGAVRHGRTFAIEYDITGANLAKFDQIMYDDWKYLVDELKVTSHPNYQRHAGKPVLSVWGMGLHEDRHVPHDPKVAAQVVAWFKSGADPKYRVTYMGGTPSRWRTLTSDARPEEGWRLVYAEMDVIQPWTIGRYRDVTAADKWSNEMIAKDLELANKNRQLYMPVVFPGFSWYNLKRNAPQNAIPRNRGEFLWRQAYNAKVAGATMLKIAMFDEVNESTAIFKVASRRDQAPDQGFWLTLDADGADLPSDWYLRLAGEITRMFHDEIKPDPKLPANPGSSQEPSRH